jgi:hypothetical protein
MDLYRTLADYVSDFHEIWEISLASCLILAIFRALAARCWIVMIVSTFAGQALFQGCPLTELEYALRAMDDPSVPYAESPLTYLLESVTDIQSPVLIITLSVVIIFLCSTCLVLGITNTKSYRTLEKDFYSRVRR